jgi:hypothetical protein
LTRKPILLAALLTILTTSAPAANFIWFTNNAGNATPWVDFLTTNGFNVQVRTDLGTLDATKINVLNSADLIIMARATSSGDFATNAAVVTQWVGIATPIIVGNAYIAFFTGTGDL